MTTRKNLPFFRTQFLLMSRCSVTALVAIGAFSVPAWAEDDATDKASNAVDRIVVIAQSQPTPMEEIGASVTVVDLEAIQNRQHLNISDLLRDVPGLAVSQSGNVGSLTNVRIRGAESDQVLVFVDGVESNDPGQDNTTAFASISTFDVERIEVLRGASSALYGSEAVGGVINMITKSGRPGLQMEAEAQGGSFDSYVLGAAVGGGTEKAVGRLSVQYHDTDGVNASLTGAETETFENLTVNGKFRIEPNDLFNVEGSLRYVDTEGGQDDFNAVSLIPNRAGIYSDASNFNTQKELSGRLKGELVLFDGAWTHGLEASVLESENNSIAGADSSFPGEFPTDGQRWKYQYKSTGQFDTGAVSHRVTGAAEYENSEFKASNNVTVDDEQVSLIGEYHLGVAEKAFVTFGVRQDYNDLFDNATTYRVSTSVPIAKTGTRFHSSYGTGIVNPTFRELFNPSFQFQPNPNLQPQKAKSFDFGVEQTLFNGRLGFDVTYFRAVLDEEINFAFQGGAFVPFNEDGKSHRQGVEVSATAQVTDNFTLDASYSWTESQDSDGFWEIRRPRHMGSVNATYSFMEDRGVVDLGVNYNGVQRDVFFNTFFEQIPVELEDYVQVNISGRFALTDNVEVFGRIENVLDEAHEDIYGFNSSGISAYGGFRVNFDLL